MLKDLVERNYILKCLSYMYYNFRYCIRYKKGNIATDSGMTHAKINIDQSLAYIKEVFDDYKKYSGIKKFFGKVAEVGPGDNCGVGLLFLADGSSSVDLVDKFYSRRDVEKHSRIYSAMINSWPSIEKLLKGCDLRDESTFFGLKRHYGNAASAELFFDRPSGYNFIVSRSVMEHVLDPILALEKMATALAPGGMLLHKVDLRDHGMFSNTWHELTFLQVPDLIYQLMTNCAGLPNRIMVNEYREKLSSLDVSAKILVTRLAGAGDIIPHREFNEIPLELRMKSLDYVRDVKPFFARRLRRLKDEDLAVAGFFLVAKKNTF